MKPRTQGKQFTQFMEVLGQMNSEIRTIPNRYGGGWICVVAFDEMKGDFWEIVEDLSTGDNEHANAKEWLDNKINQEREWFSIGYGFSCYQAIANALSSLSRIWLKNITEVDIVDATTHDTESRYIYSFNNNERQD